jgi:putative transposase
MLQRQLKVRLTTRQTHQVSPWLWHLTGVWNWAIKKIEADANDGIFSTPTAFHNLLANHGKKLDIPSHTLQGTLSTAHTAWQRCFTKLAKKPKLKGQRNKLASIPFPDPLKAPEGNTIKVPGLGVVRFHAQTLPEGTIKGARLVQRASGWYLCLFIDANPQGIPHRDNGLVGIDPGFLSLITLSTGEKVPHPQELKHTAHRLAQAQRGTRKRLAARLQERLANQRQDHNHQLSHRLVADHQCLVWSKDSHKALARMFGKSVASARHAQLRMMLAYKCTASGRQFTAVPSKFSTMTCAACGARTGPTGYAGLQVRHWTCEACGASHDRDVNAAMNTLVAGLGTSHESRCKPTPGIPWLEPWGGSNHKL